MNYISLQVSDFRWNCLGTSTFAFSKIFELFNGLVSYKEKCDESFT